MQMNEHQIRSEQERGYAKINILLRNEACDFIPLRNVYHVTTDYLQD